MRKPRVADVCDADAASASSQAGASAVSAIAYTRVAAAGTKFSSYALIVSPVSRLESTYSQRPAGSNAGLKLPKTGSVAACREPSAIEYSHTCSSRAAVRRVYASQRPSGDQAWSVGSAKSSRSTSRTVPVATSMIDSRRAWSA